MTGLVYFSEPQGYIIRRLKLPVHSCLVNRSEKRGQTKSNPNKLIESYKRTTCSLSRLWLMGTKPVAVSRQPSVDWATCNQFGVNLNSSLEPSCGLTACNMKGEGQVQCQSDGRHVIDSLGQTRPLE